MNQTFPGNQSVLFFLFFSCDQFVALKTGNARTPKIQAISPENHFRETMHYNNSNNNDSNNNNTGGFQRGNRVAVVVETDGEEEEERLSEIGVFSRVTPFEVNKERNESPQFLRHKGVLYSQHNPQQQQQQQQQQQSEPFLRRPKQDFGG